MNNIDDRIIALARKDIAMWGYPETGDIADTVGVSRSTVRKVLRRADRDGGLGRTCTTTLGNGKRCGAPLPREAWGRLGTTCCALHTKLDAAGSTLVNVAGTIAEAGTGEAVPKAPGWWPASVALRPGDTVTACRVPDDLDAPVKTHPLSALADLDTPIPYRPAAPAMPEELSTALDGLTVEVVDGEPRASAFQLAELLGFKAPRQIKELIDRNRATLKRVGAICVRRTARRTQMPTGGVRETEVDIPWLNRTQCILVTGKANTANAEDAQIKIARSFEREQDRAAEAASAPALDSGLGPIVAELVKGQQQTAQALASLTASLASLASRMAAQVPPRRPAPSPTAPANQLLLSPAFDPAASAEAKGDYLSVSDIASRVGLPMDDLRRESSKRLVTTWLQETRLWRLPSVSRNIRMGVVAGGHASERDHWVYDPEVLAFWEAGVLRDAVASVIGSGNISTRRAYETARAIIRVGLGRKAS